MKKTSLTKYVFTLITLTALSLSVFAQPAIPPQSFLDFSGDQRTDFVLVRNNGSNGLVWDILRNQSSGPDVRTTFTWGNVYDQVTPADYFGGSKTEISYYRGSQAMFWETAFSDGMTSVLFPSLLSWGAIGDVAAYPGDYDGDGKDDHITRRIQNGFYYWYIKGSGGVNRTVQFGQTYSGWSTITYRGADYNGDGRDELVVAYIPNTAGSQTYWYFGDSITGGLIAAYAYGYANNDWLLNPADYTGDGKADLILVSSKNMNWPQYWAVRDPRTGTGFSWHFNPVPFNGDRPISGDYDGDGIFDAAWYRPSPSTFYFTPSSSRTAQAPFGTYQVYRQFGNTGDYPVALYWVY